MNQNYFMLAARFPAPHQYRPLFRSHRDDFGFLKAALLQMHAVISFVARAEYQPLQPSNTRALATRDGNAASAPEILHPQGAVRFR
jgi:hypothetical protein